MLLSETDAIEREGLGQRGDDELALAHWTDGNKGYTLAFPWGESTDLENEEQQQQKLKGKRPSEHGDFEGNWKKTWNMEKENKKVSSHWEIALYRFPNIRSLVLFLWET